MDQIFGGCAQGTEKFTPVADLDPPPQDEAYAPSPPPYSVRLGQSGYNDIDEVGYNLENEWDAMWRDASPMSPNLQDTINNNSDKNKGKRVMESDSSRNNKSAKREITKRVGGSVALSEKIDGMVQMISKRNNSTKEFQTAMANIMNTTNSNTPKYTITDAMIKLCSMTNLDSNTPEFYYACMLIEDPQRRTIFLEFPDDIKRVEYIRFMYARQRAEK